MSPINLKKTNLNLESKTEISSVEKNQVKEEKKSFFRKFFFSDFK